MSYTTCHSAVLEQTLRWQDLSVLEQDALINALKTNNTDNLVQVFDVVMPSYFTILFPLHLVNPQAPADAVGRAQMLVDIRASKQDAGLQNPAPDSSGAASTENQ